MNALANLREQKQNLLSDLGLKGELYFAGETAKQLDPREISAKDTWTIGVLETLFILVLLWLLIRSLKTALYMISTILISFAAALGLGILFGYDAINIRVPIYAFIFLVALGIDYNIILMSRFKEERNRNSLKDAVQISVSRTGGMISSAGIILAATFAVLMTQPVTELFVLDLSYRWES